MSLVVSMFIYVQHKRMQNGSETKNFLTNLNKEQEPLGTSISRGPVELMNVGLETH